MMSGIIYKVIRIRFQAWWICKMRTNLIILCVLSVGWRFSQMYECSMKWSHSWMKIIIFLFPWQFKLLWSFPLDSTWIYKEPFLALEMARGLPEEFQRNRLKIFILWLDVSQGTTVITSLLTQTHISNLVCCLLERSGLIQSTKSVLSFLVSKCPAEFACICPNIDLLLLYTLWRKINMWFVVSCN